MPKNMCHSIRTVFLLLVSYPLLVHYSHQSSPGLPTFEDLDINDDEFAFDSMDIGGQEDTEPNEHLPDGLKPSVATNTIKAVAVLRGLRTYGVVRFTQIGSGPTSVSGFVAGLNPFSFHGIHVHQHKISGNCESAGSHYNPTKQNHGSPDSIISHVGDLGNLQADAQGVSRFNAIVHKLSLRGKFSVIERGLVVHQNQDDLGTGYNRESLESGNSGGRIACGTIKFVSIGKN